MTTPTHKNADDDETSERIAKRIARAGLCSRRDAEKLIEQGRVSVDGQTLTTPAFVVNAQSQIIVDGKPLPEKEKTRLWLYHKPRGLMTSHHDPEGRPTVFAALAKSLPRVVSVGRLDFNSEGLLLLTNDGGLARQIELPSTGWRRRYRVRVYGRPSEDDLKSLAKGITVEGINYGPIEAHIERAQGSNPWLSLTLTEGKNREIRRVLAHLGLQVNRLIRVSFGPFQLSSLQAGEFKEVPARVIEDQISGLLKKPSQPDGKAPRKTQSRKTPSPKPKPHAYANRRRSS